MKKKVVAVGMSGGVDSSVAAHLLQKKGYHVIGLFMKNWDENDAYCPAAQDYEDALQVADQLKISLHAFNFSKEYWDHVFTRFLAELQSGRTPNPDIWCNKEIKFKVFYDKAMDLGADFLATGHYATVGPSTTLLRGIDANKDQTYFLYTLKQALLQKIIFPIGVLQKEEVRRIATELNLATANKKDSTGICFIGKRNFTQFLRDYIPAKQGEFQNEWGEFLGHHDGIWNYTIGQRKGMGIGGPGEPWFVAKKELSTNTVTLVKGEDHPLLHTKTLEATELSWVKEIPLPPYSCTAKVRYRQTDQPCTILKIEGDQATILFDAPLRAATPGQSIVFYQGEVCLGGGIISNTVSHA